MSWIIDALRPFARWTQAKVALQSSQTVEWDPNAFLLTYDAAGKRVVVSFAAAIVAAVFEALHVTGDATVDGAIIQGPAITKGGAVTTSGGATLTIISVPIAANSLCAVRFNILVQMGAGYFHVASAANTLYQTSGSPGPIGDQPNQYSASVPMLPSADESYVGGNYMLTVTGPTATITGAADNGSGGTRITISKSILGASLTGQSLTISGVVGAVGINGAHVVTRIDSMNFDIPVVFVSYGSGGVAVFTTPPVLKWVALLTAVVAPP